MDLIERTFVGQYALPAFALEVRRAGTLVDADNDRVVVTMVNEASDVQVFERTATRTALGVYEILLASTETSALGNYTLRWSYVLDGVGQMYATPIEVGTTSPAYDALDVGFRGIIESVWTRFADLFDSPLGGPHIQVYFQSHFGRGRLAQLLGIAVGRLNTIAQPHQTYSLDAHHNPFPFAKWGPLLEQALFVETLKHLVRSYAEQPVATGVTVARMDRRDYMDRWQSILTMEREELQTQLGVFKIAHMGLGRPHVTVAGGLYGNYTPNRLPTSAIARPRFAYAHFV